MATEFWMKLSGSQALERYLIAPRIPPGRVRFSTDIREYAWISCGSGHIVSLEFAPDYLEGPKGRLLFQGAQKLFHSHMNSLEHLDAS